MIVRTPCLLAKAKKTADGQSGLTLIEIAIGLIVLGVLLAPFLDIYRLQQISEDKTKTFDSVNSASAAIRNYALKNGALPTPAMLEEPTGLPPTYLKPGIAVEPADLPSSCTSVPPVATNGVFCVKGSRDTDADADTVVDSVLIGAVPYATLGLSESMSLDKEGHKLTYAVSRYMTDPTKFKDTRGVLRVNNQNGTYITGTNSTSASPLFLIVSHGTNGKGAYSKGGSLVTACEESSEADLENCDMDFIFAGLQTLDKDGVTLLPKIFQGFNLNETDSTKFYDDIISFTSSTADRLWTARQENLFLTAGGKVGIGTADGETPKNQLHVSGNVKAKDMVTNQVCDGGSLNCFTVKNIVTSAPTATQTLLCPTSRGLRRVAGNATKATLADRQCDTYTQLPSDVLSTPCPNGIKGINSDGDIQCK